MNYTTKSNFSIQDLNNSNLDIKQVLNIFDKRNIEKLLSELNISNPSKKSRFNKTIVFVFLSLFHVIKIGLHITTRDWYDCYAQLCHKNGFRSRSFRSFERLLNKICDSEDFNSKDNDDNGIYNVAYLSGGQLHYMDKNTKSNLVILFLFKIIEQIYNISDDPLGHGYNLRQAMNYLKISKIVSIDGTYLLMPDLTGENEEQQNSCKGLSGTYARKFHIGLNIETLTIESLAIGSDVSNERIYELFTTQETGVLFLCDSGYVDFVLFNKIDDDNNYFIIKGRKNLNPIVKSCKIYKPTEMLDENNETIACNNLELVKELSDEDCKNLDMEKPDLMYKELRKIIKAENQSQSMLDDQYCLDMMIDHEGSEFRVIRMFNPNAKGAESEDEQFNYLYTNLPQDEVSPLTIWLAYKGRWQIENFFKGLKSSTGLDHRESSSKVLFDIYSLASIVTHLIKMRLGQICQTLTKKTWFLRFFWCWVKNIITFSL